MSTTVISTIKFKRGTEARWAEVNPILENGEPGYVYDKHKFKIGDGVTHWNDLPYMDGKTEVKLAAVASTGSTDDLIAGTEIWIFDCGNASRDNV